MIKKVAIFPYPKKIGKRDWGEEILAALIPKKISLKILKIKKGKKGGLQYHRKKKWMWNCYLRKINGNVW